MGYITTDFLSGKRLTVSDKERILKITYNARVATKIYYKGTSIEVIFTNLGKFDGSEVTYVLPLKYLNSKQIYTLLSYKKRSKNERRRRHSKTDNNHISSRQRS